MMLAIASCDNGQKGPQEKPLAEFSITMNDVERTIEVGVNPSDSSVFYVFDLLTEEEYLAIGANEEGIKQLVSDEIASGVTSYEYTDLLYMSTYYAYAVQIDNNDGVVTVNGTPVVMNKSLKKSFTTFEPQEMAIAPFAISDNGYYLVGNFQDGSYLYDLRRDELTIVPAIALNDITNDGIAFGQDLTSYEGVIYRNGEIEYVQGIEGAAETCFFSVNPEGTLAVGYCMDAAYSIVPIKYEKKMYEDAARQYLRGYYLFPKESYAVKNLEGAKVAYDARGMKAQSKKVSELIKTYSIDNKKASSVSTKKASKKNKEQKK